MTKGMSQDEAAQAPEERPAVENVFVFGTLMRGEPLHDVLRKHGLELGILAEVPGRLYEVDGRPVLVLSDDPKERVPGELIRCRDREGLCRAFQVVHESRVPVAAVPPCRRELLAAGTMDGHVREVAGIPRLVLFKAGRAVAFEEGFGTRTLTEARLEKALKAAEKPAPKKRRTPTTGKTSRRPGCRG